MAQFGDLEWVERPGGFETNFQFENFHQIHISCGAELYNSSAEDSTARGAASEYNSFEWKTFDGVTLLDDDAWITGTKAELEAELTRVAGLVAVFTPPTAEE